MIKEVTGDILLSKADLLAHGISAFDPFDSGLALALRERWPSLVKDYRHDTSTTVPDTSATGPRTETDATQVPCP